MPQTKYKLDDKTQFTNNDNRNCDSNNPSAICKIGEGTQAILYLSNQKDDKNKNLKHTPWVCQSTSYTHNHTLTLTYPSSIPLLHFLFTELGNMFSFSAICLAVNTSFVCKHLYL